jgi:hypothetical protein
MSGSLKRWGKMNVKKIKEPCVSRTRLLAERRKGLVVL